MTNEQLLEQITELTDRFTRKIPQTPEYKDRLAEEIDLIIELRFTKHFVRMLTREELTDEEVILYYDIVQSVVATKLLTAYDEEKSKVGVEVMAYTSEDDEGDMWIYEIVLEEHIEPAEGDNISEELFKEFDDLQFTFEASIEI